MIPKQPSEIAREALKRLATRKLPPTPANFQACYHEIAGLPDMVGFPEEHLRKVVRSLRARLPIQRERLDQLDEAIGRHSWQGVEEALAGYVGMLAENIAPAQAGNWLGEVAELIECLLPVLGSEDGELSATVETLLGTLRSPSPDPARIRAGLADFSRRLSYATELQVEIKDALLKLLHLLIENIGVLAMDDHWLRGQIDALLFAISPPLDLRRLDSVENRLRDVMAKQSQAKARSVTAQAEMRQMLAAFVEHLALMSTHSATFQHRIEDSARRIEQISSVEELAPLLQEVVSATRDMAEEAAREHHQFEELQNKAEATEAEIAKLHQELVSVSDLARHDPLTDALNRKGLDEALAREIDSMRRHGTALSVALLDVDNFKRINDRLGHEGGDAALVHLVNVVRGCLRPMDCLARYGGEEFIILLPDTDLDGGIKAMTRFQRELTKHFFLGGGERILITFSAGVAQIGAEESGAEAIKRADAAMYLAKRAGKNRVMGA